jgi:hypothetical protein
MAERFDKDRTESYMALTRGTRVGRYRVVDKIGAGGMGGMSVKEKSGISQ